jgi:hypothetical protein
MRGVQFTSSPPTIPCPSRLSDNFYSSEKYVGLVALLREYIKIYTLLGKAHAQAHITRHQVMSVDIGTEIDARDIDPTDFRCAGIIKHVEMNGNYAVDFGQGKMKYISESTLQEILKDRETVRNQSKWRTAIQQEIEMLLLREEFSNIDAPMTDNVWIDERASDGRQFLQAQSHAVPLAQQVRTSLNERTQWIRSTLVICVGLGLLYSPMLMAISLIDLAYTSIVLFTTGHAVWAVWSSSTTIRTVIGTTIRMAIRMSIWAHLPLSRSIPIFPAIGLYAGTIFSVHFLCQHHYSGTLPLGNISPKQSCHSHYCMPGISISRLSASNAGLRCYEYLWQIPGQTNGYARFWLQ